MKPVKNEDYFSREFQLGKIAHKLFGAEPPDENRLEKLPYPYVTLKYLTATRIAGHLIYFRDAYDPREKYGPIQLPKLFWGLIRREDTFLGCLGHEEDRWEILYLSEIVLSYPE